jgi:hypothetical protein
MPKNKPPNLEMRYDGKELTLRLGGKLIAKRGEPGTPQARTWVSLEPGIVVYDETSSSIVVEHRKPIEH